MWKITVVYNDGSNHVIEGKNKAISILDAKSIYDGYTKDNKVRELLYLQYPKKNNKEITLLEYIETQLKGNAIIKANFILPKEKETDCHWLLYFLEEYLKVADTRGIKCIKSYLIAAREGKRGDR